MSTQNNNETNLLELRAIEAQLRDVGRGIARLDPGDIERLNASTGDIIEIIGKRSTVAKLMPSFKEFRGQQVLQIDGITRDNAGIYVNEKVSIKVAQPQIATLLQLTPVTSIARRSSYGNYIGKLIDGLAVMEGDRIRATLFGSKFQEFKICHTEPAGVVIIHPTTVFTITDSRFQATSIIEKQINIAYEDVGGLRREIERIREMIELPFKYPSVFERLGVDPPRGLLLVGPPGVGKTLITRVITHETRANFISINGPEILNKFHSETESRLRQAFEEATRNQPAIIFIDEIDLIAPNRDTSSNEIEKRILSQLLTLMDNVKDRAQIVVIGATNAPNSLDPTLRKSGRFDREIRLEVPNVEDRREILEIHSRGMPLAEDVSLKSLSSMTNGFVGADIQNLCREATMAAIRRSVVLSGSDIDPNLVEEQLAQICICMDDFHQALKIIPPSTETEITIQIPDENYPTVCGLDELYQELLQAILLSLNHSNLFSDVKVRPMRSILLYGLSGIGKKFIARTLANESHSHFISVKISELLLNRSTELKSILGNIFHKAKQISPCIVFFDEIDLLGLVDDSHNRIESRYFLTQFVSELNNIQASAGVIIITAANSLDLVNAELRRSGCFDLIREVMRPNSDGLVAVFENLLKKYSLLTEVDFTLLAEASAGFSGADVEDACRIAATHAINKSIGIKENNQTKSSQLLITQDMLISAIKQVFQMRY